MQGLQDKIEEERKHGFLLWNAGKAAVGCDAGGDHQKGVAASQDGV